MDTLPGQPRLAVEVHDLRARRDALRQAAALPDADVRPTLDAALAELDAAIDALAAASGGPPAEEPTELLAERRLLRAVFQDAPVPLFLLEPDGAIRRANRSAGRLLGTGTGYATGRPFTAFVDLRSRAAAHSQLAAVVRTGKSRRFRSEMLTGEGSRPCLLTAGLARQRGDADQLIVAVESSGEAPSAAPTTHLASAHPAPPSAVVARMARRQDLVTSVTRLLLENAATNEAATLQRCARLLAEEFASWVIVDLARSRGLRRQLVVGPDDQRSADLAREVAACVPQPDTIPSVVHTTGSARLIAHAEDADVLGKGPGGLPLLMALGATSVLSVPLAAGERAYGALTLARHADAQPFSMADLGLVEELGEQLALALRMDREVRRRMEIADALRESLVPRTPPRVPGADLAITHVAATEAPEVGGDFCDVFRRASGWGLAIGDVCGRGAGVAAASAAARHAIRVIAYSTPDPGDVLARANDLMLAEELGGRFVTACVATAEQREGSLRVTLATAGHPPPLLVRNDGRAERLGEGGLPLGIFADIESHVESCDLAAGDTLLLFTDGLTDARGGSEYFADRLTSEAAALAGRPAQQVLSRLRDSVLEFGGGDIRDDITIVAVRAADGPAAQPA